MMIDIHSKLTSNEYNEYVLFPFPYQKVTEAILPMDVDRRDVVREMQSGRCRKHKQNKQRITNVQRGIW